MTTWWVYNQLENQGNRARGDWDEYSIIWSNLEIKNTRCKSNIFSQIFKDCVQFYWPNSLYYIFITFPDQKDKDWPCRTPTRNFNFLTKSHDRFLIYREIQSILRLAINSWARLESTWTTPTHQHTQNQP